MSDEITTPAEVIETEATPEPTAEAPATPSDEAIAEALGVDVDYLRENKSKFRDFNKFYSELNRRSMELSAKEKEVPSAPKKDTEDDDTELDERSRRLLRKVMEDEFGDVFNLVRSTTVDAVGQVIEDFSAKHSDADPTRISEVMDELNLWTPIPSQLKKNMEKAYKLVKAEATDVDAIAEQKAQELFEKYLADKGLDRDDIVSVKKSPKPETIDAKDWRNPELTPQERFAILRAKNG